MRNFGRDGSHARTPPILLTQMNSRRFGGGSARACSSAASLRGHWSASWEALEESGRLQTAAGTGLDASALIWTGPANAANDGSCASGARSCRSPQVRNPYGVFEIDADRSRVSAWSHEEVVFQLSLVAVVHQINAGATLVPPESGLHAYAHDRRPT